MSSILFGRKDDVATQELHALALAKGVEVEFRDIGEEPKHLSEFLGRGLSRFPHLSGYGDQVTASATLNALPDVPVAETQEAPAVISGQENEHEHE